jgi:hypothetical protein
MSWTETPGGSSLRCSIIEASGLPASAGKWARAASPKS